MLVAIDPGCYDSGVVQLTDDGAILHAAQWSNVALRDWLVCNVHPTVIEMITQPGRAGRETYETCVWIGRFIETVGDGLVTVIRRDDVRFHWAGDASGNDSVLRQAVIDEYGGKEIAIGSKRSPGPLAGIKSHCWQALALALAYQRGCRSKVFTRADKVTK